jgi:hypothetical protein
MEIDWTSKSVDIPGLTRRARLRHATSLTYAFSKKWDNLKAALALHFMRYNSCRVHGSLRITPAMATGIADHVWDLQDLIGAPNA